MCDEGLAESGTEAQRDQLRAAASELARSLWRLGRAIASSPMRMLPDETRDHLRAAKREAVEAGAVLGRGVVCPPSVGTEDWRAELDELEERLAEM
jgi:hypothetical protein